MTPDQLLIAVKDGKCVIGFNSSGKGHMPAAFLASMQFNRVMEVLPRLKIYIPKPKQKHTPWRTHL